MSKKPRMAMTFATFAIAILLTTFQTSVLGQDINTDTDQFMKSLSSWINLQEDGSAKIWVRLSLCENWNCYSIGQKEGGPLPTSIRLESIGRDLIAVDFRPVNPPKTFRFEAVWPDIEIEIHSGVVLWEGSLAKVDVDKLTGKDGDTPIVVFGDLKAVFENFVEPCSVIQAKRFAVTAAEEKGARCRKGRLGKDRSKGSGLFVE